MDGLLLAVYYCSMPFRSTVLAMSHSRCFTLLVCQLAYNAADNLARI